MMLWVKVFVFLCVVLDLTSSYSYYYRRSHKNRHRHVYKCGYQKCIRRKSPPVCKQWCVIYVNNGYCQQSRYTCCVFNEKPGYCSPSQNVCAWPFPYYFTQAYQCQHDFNCPAEYKCCYDSCYVHKVCKPSTDSQTKPTYPPKEPETTTSYLEEEMTTKTTEGVFTTTQKITTSTEELTTQEEITEEATTTQEETTATKEVTTIAAATTQKPTTQEVTTSRETTTEEVPTTQKTNTTMTSTSVRTTTVDETEGSGGEFGSGDTDLPEPPAARFMLPRNTFGTFSDDEDFINDIME